MDTRLREQLANERTFLAWIRTSLAIMGFGFVVVKFALFLAHFTTFFDSHEAQSSYSSYFGYCMVIFGLFMACFSYINYKRTNYRLSEGNPTFAILPLLLTLFIISMGMFLLIYLAKVL